MVLYLSVGKTVVTIEDGRTAGMAESGRDPEAGSLFLGVLGMFTHERRSHVSEGNP
jgi:hypothetical protein